MKHFSIRNIFSHTDNNNQEEKAKVFVHWSCFTKGKEKQCLLIILKDLTMIFHTPSRVVPFRNVPFRRFQRKFSNMRMVQLGYNIKIPKAPLRLKENG